MTLVVVLLGVAVAILTLLVLSLFRSHAEIIRALSRAGITPDDEGAPSGYPDRTGTRRKPLPSDGGGIHDIVGVSPGGGPTRVSVTGVDGLILLAFLSSGCRTCEKFWKALAEPDLQLPDPRVRLVIVGQDPVYESETTFAGLVPPGVKAVLSSTAWQDYDVPGSPYFTLLHGADDRVLGAGTAADWEQMRGILQRALDGYTAKFDGHRGRASGQDRERRADDALLAAGIGPGHPSVHPDGLAPDGNESPDQGFLTQS